MNDGVAILMGAAFGCWIGITIIEKVVDWTDRTHRRMTWTLKFALGTSFVGAVTVSSVAGLAMNLAIEKLNS